MKFELSCTYHTNDRNYHYHGATLLIISTFLRKYTPLTNYRCTYVHSYIPLWSRCKYFANWLSFKIQGKNFKNVSHCYVLVLITWNVITCGAYIDHTKYSINLVIRGSHIYKASSNWCDFTVQRETLNPSDPYAVATLHDTVVVGHTCYKLFQLLV